MEMNETQKKQIAEINQHIKDGIKQWFEICLVADADNWAQLLDYDKEDIMHVCLLFQHVCSNIGIKNSIINENNAEDFGNSIRELAKRMTGEDTRTIIDDLTEKQP